MNVRAVDGHALKILFSTYWSPSGWKKTYATPPDDLEYAKAAGLMFEPRPFSHDQMVDWAVSSRARASKAQVANAFLSSLTSRRLDWRSALGSFAVSLNLSFHHWSKRSSSEFQCAVCGAYESNEKRDLNVLNFERFKWGGVRHTDPLYIGFDLDQSSREEPPQPTSADRSAMRAILDTARSMPPNAKLSDLTAALSKVFLSNASERRTLIGILGYSGILRVPSKPGFISEFPSIAHRPIVPWAKNDWPYPVQWWNGSCGVSNQATDFWFPGL
jgi:hypothetical protein